LYIHNTVGLDIAPCGEYRFLTCHVHAISHSIHVKEMGVNETM